MDFSGKWRNAKNSILELVQDGNSVSGTFDSGVSDGDEVLLVPVVGWANGDRISFTVTYEKFGTVVAWVGQVRGEPGQPEIDAHFLHESDVEDASEFEELWASTRVGSDLFRRI